MKKHETKSSSKLRRTVTWLVVLLGVVLLALLALVVRITFFKPVEVNSEKYPIAGIDISAHNGKVDFAKVKADSITFVYIKATEGASFKDRLWEHNYSRATAAGLVVGAYHFFRFDVNGTMQALNLMQSIEGKHLQLPVAIDVEHDGNPEVAPETVIERLREMITYLEEHNLEVIIYTNVNGYNQFIHRDFSDYAVWICRIDFSPSENIEWQLWQVSHTRKVNGVNGNVDYNVFMGSRKAWERWISNDESIDF